MGFGSGGGRGVRIMNFRIVDVFTQDGQLIVRAEHFHANGSPWFTEHYTWQGREAFKQKRETNIRGEMLLDSGEVCPSVPIPFTNQRHQVLPPGRNWKYRPGPHMDDGSVLSEIRATHQKRLVSGWPDSTDTLSAFKHTTADDAGCDTLRRRFLALVGREE